MFYPFRLICTNMKKTFFAVVSCLLALSVNAQEWVGVSKNASTKIQETLVSSSEKKIVVDVEIGGFYKKTVRTQQGEALIISGEGMAYMPEKGAPNLPMYPISMIVGDEAEMEVSIVKSQYVDFENIEVAPSKGNFSRQINPDDVPYVYGDMYQKDAFYPARQAELGEPYILRDFRGQNMMVYPYAYNPVTKTLRVYTYLRIEANKVSDNGVNKKLNRKRSNVVDPEVNASYKRRFINYPSKERYAFLEDEGEMLIVCADKYMAAVESLVEWKNISGRPTTMVAVSKTGSDLKSYVQKYYNENPEFTYLLLVGEHSDIPAQSMSGGRSDVYYGMLDGNDEYEEVFVGRLSVNSMSDAVNQVNKIIYYERDIDESATWLTRASGIAADEGEGHYGEIDYQHMDFIRDTLLHYTYTDISRYYANVNNPVAPQMIVDYSKGLGLINYCNHGTPTSWAVASFSTEEVHRLTNDNKWPIVWSVACNNGEFDFDECFGEAWMRAVNPATGASTGAIGGMFSWISQPWQPPMYGQDEMNAILTEWRDGYKHTLGGASCNGSMYMMDMDPSEGPRTHNTWILFGDPSLMVRTEAPKSMDVNVPQKELFIGMTSLNVNAQTEYGIATLSLNGKAIASAPVVDGVAALTFDPLIKEETAKLVVIGYNKVTEIKEFNVEPADRPYLVYDGHQFSDDNQKLEYGESVNISMDIKNIGLQPTENVTVKLSTSSKYVTITKDNAQISSVKAEEKISLKDAFTVFVKPNVPNETKIEFIVTCSNGKETWETSFYAYAYAPVLAINNISMEVGKIIQPGASSTLTVEFANVGGAPAYDVIAEVFSSSSDVTFENTSVMTEEVLVGETYTASMDFSVASSITIGSVYDILCTVNSDHSVGKKSYEMKVGLMGDNFETGDFSANDWKIETNSNGKGTWVIDSLNAYEGKYCVKSDKVSNNQYAKLKVQIEVLEDGPLSFYLRTSSEGGYDFLEFYINSLIDQKWSGVRDYWEVYTKKMKKGTYALEWRYKKDSSGSEGEDRAYLDDISFPPVSVVTMLEAVKGLTYNIQDENLTLTWNEVENAEDYIVRRDGEIVATQNATSFNESVVNGIVTYTVVARNGNNYSAPAFIVVDSNVKSPENIVKVESKKVSLYPNPTSGMLYIELDNSFDAVVYNYQGQVVMREYNNDGQMNLSALSAGIYFVEIRDGNNVMIEKVIVK